jgi:RHH-type transcriptional regulator, rel operon repressor / antitoxin RelB
MSASATKDAQVSVRLPADLNLSIGNYSALTGRTKSHVVMEALTEYLHWRVPQTADLQQAITAADNGEFASDEEVRAVFAEFGVGTKAPTASDPKPRKRAR